MTSNSPSGKEPLLVQSEHQEWSVSVLLPFEPRTNTKKSIENSIRRLMESVEEQLLQQGSRHVAWQISGQLKQLFNQLDYGAASKSVALWANAEKGRLVYWNIAVSEAVVIGADFDVRSLLAHSRDEKQYLLLGMGEHFAGIYLGNDKQLSKLVANAPVHAYGKMEAEADKDANRQQELKIERTVRHFDNALGVLLRAYQLPVFVLAPAAYLSFFKTNARSAANAATLIEVPASINEYGLQQRMAPYLSNWQSLKEKRLLNQLDGALQAGKLAVGISEVWTAASKKRGKLLVAEEDYFYPAYLDTQQGTLYADAIPLSQWSRPTKDAVADAMELVLASGGKVELVSKGSLAEYVHVAMVCY